MGMETLASSKDSKIENVEIIVSFAFPSTPYSTSSHPSVSNKTSTLLIYLQISETIKKILQLLLLYPL